MSAGKRFKDALMAEQPLQIVGAINAYSAILAEQAGFGALYLSGAGVANASLGLPDLGLTTLDDVLTDVRRITGASDLPLLVDIDTGFESDRGIAQTITEMIHAGAAGVHIEDQVEAKRCGHREGKKLVCVDDMVDRIRKAVATRETIDPDFVIMARTDALAVEGVDTAIARSHAYIRAGANMIFAEALENIDEYQRFTKALEVPILANITEFGKTPLYHVSELDAVGVAMVLYPLSAFRAMSAAAKSVYQAIRHDGTQVNVIDKMQTRKALYDCLDYERYEQQQRSQHND